MLADGKQLIYAENMSIILTIGIRTAILTLYEEYFFTRGRLRRHPLANTLAADFETFEAKLQTTLLAELGLIGNRYEGDAAVEFVDVDLDGLLDGIAAVTLIEAKNDRGSLPYSHYFSSQRPSELRRPILSAQLDTMRSWSPSLKQSSNQALVGYGTKLESKVTEADDCETFQRSAQTQLSDFRVIGGRKACIDELNARRKALHGKLGELQHQHPELGTGWADSFFRQGSGSDKPTLRELEKRLAAAEEEVLSLKKRRDELVAHEEAVAQSKAEAERAQRLAELAAAKKAAAEVAARIADLENKLGEKNDP
jgi:hypothetical protein